MKHGLWLALFVLLGIAAVICTTGLLRDGGLSPTAGARAAEKGKDQKPKGPPPLVVDKNAPLLLEEPPEKDPWDVPVGPVADNIACYCCHANYEEEPFVVYHAKANVGCVKCHGQSYDHRDDEDNVTPPDIMFPPEKIEANCRECHETHDAPAREVIARWQEGCPDKSKPEQILCMDCHGKHRLESRTVRWDKTTGKLIVRQEKGRLKKAADPDKNK
ncbi:MAG: cytochrome c3 family protein, partial [Planctomycetota bacterium]